MIPDVMLVFDDRAWYEARRDVYDNSMFWRPARVIRWYTHNDYPVLVDVVFLLDGRESHAHFWESHPFNSILTYTKE